MPSANPPISSAKPFSISFGSKPKPSSVPAPKKRSHSALAEPDSDHEDETSGPQLVSAFDQSGAVVTNGGPKAKAQLVIQAEKNRDWREESRKKRRKNLLPADVQAAQSGKDGKVAHVERNEISKVSGIQFIQREADEDTTMSELEAAQRTPEQPVKPPKTADEEAMEALLGGEKKSTLQIPALEEDDQNGYDLSEPAISDFANEDEKFRADVASRPDVATLEDYGNVPVEDFGAALLRGMGWKDGEAIGKRRAGIAAPKEPKIKERRPALLGIGAKEVPSDVGDEPGAWGSAKKGKGKGKVDMTCIPVVMRNNVTGETYTEEQLLQKSEQKKEEDRRERRDKNLRIDQEKKSEKRGKERLTIEDGRNGDRSYDLGRDSERRKRDRSRSPESHRHDRSGDRERRRDRSREGDRRKRDLSRETNGSRHSHARPRSKSRERGHHSSSRRDRSRSAERKHRRY